MRKRVVITGLGAVAPNGTGVEKFWSALVNGVSGIDRITRFDTANFPSAVAGEVTDFNALDYMTPKEAEKSALYSQYAVAAARMATRDAGLGDLKPLSEDLRVILGVGAPAVDVLEGAMHMFMKSGDVKNVKPIPMESLFSHAPSNDIARAFGVKGSSLTVSTGCTSGANAIGVAMQEIRDGRCKIAVTGGTENMLSYYTYLAFCFSGLLSHDPKDKDNPQNASRPFDRTRANGVMSEGAGILVLEELEHARERGAYIYGELAGYECSQTPYYKDADEVQAGFERSMRLALKDANLRPEDIDHISSHGCSAKTIDLLETKAIKAVLGDYAYRVPVTAVKSMIGNPSSANGPLLLVASAMTLKTDVIPPTINLNHPDPECDLDYVPLKARRNRVNAILINAHGFTGTDATMILKRIEAN